ncbi:MAG TPA: CDP-diacylglycerol O-phosphatidyltransferase [candidate division Zixibacteria bacterium]|nr:CDP-diacylglycerol O-phosphatidyltransferase [candidate division Zixibacteria bacterium]
MGRVALAWLVHLYTASGAVIALLSILYLEQLKFQAVLWLMFLALAIDATDGVLARGARVKELIPWFDGARLDDIVDYLNYVLVPALFMLKAELLPPRDALWLAAVPLVASGYGFAHKEAKTADHFFLGFPSYWNIVAFYQFVLATPTWVNGFAVLGFALLVFVPIRYVYPSRTPCYSFLTNAFGTLWVLSAVSIVYLLPRPPRPLVLASLSFPVYYVALSLWLELQRRRGFHPGTGR